MLGLLRDWVLDPVALLFVASLLVILILVIAGSRRRSRRSRGGRSSKRRFLTFPLFLLIVCWALLFEIATAPVFVNPLVNQIEQLHARDQACESGSHVVLLSGGVNSYARSNENFERMSHATFVRASEAYRITQNEPDATLIVSGGVLKDADVEGPVRIISSALHMHRAISSFELALADTDITLCPVSVDYQGLRALQIYGWVPQRTALVKFDLLIHELVALLVYRIKGWI